MVDENLKICHLEEKYFEKLDKYLNNLSVVTLSRFAPHSFDLPTIRQFYLPENHHTGFIIEHIFTQTIVAYAIIKYGYVRRDEQRLKSYDLDLYPETDCTFAPSIADDWQGKGIGKMLFQHIKEEMQKKGMKRMILWGGVQTSNEKAVTFYQKLGFNKIGNFENKGIDNYDMVFEL